MKRMKRRSFLGAVAALFASLGSLKPVLPKPTDPEVKTILSPGRSYTSLDLSNGPVNMTSSDGTTLSFRLHNGDMASVIYRSVGIVTTGERISVRGDFTFIPLTIEDHDLAEFVTACQKAYPKDTLEFYNIYYTTKPNRNEDCFRRSNLFCRAIPVWNTPPVDIRNGYL